VIGDIDVEVLDAAGGGVVDEALGSPDAGFCGAPVPFYDEGEAVEAPKAAALERQEYLLRVVAGAEEEIEGGRRGPAALPERAPPCGERPRADGRLEREQGQDAQPQILGQRRDAVLHLRRRFGLSSLRHPAGPPLLRARSAEQQRHCRILPRLRLGFQRACIGLFRPLIRPPPLRSATGVHRRRKRLAAPRRQTIEALVV